MITIQDKLVIPSTFPDNTPAMIGLHNLLEDEISPIYTNLRYENSLEQVWIGYFEMWRKEHPIYRNCRSHLIMDYLPNARMDRQKTDKNDGFTLKYFCDYINWLGYDTVTILDPHSNVGPALLKNVKVRPPTAIIQRVIDKVKPDYILYPDNGSASRYSEYITHPYLVAWKTRRWQDGKLLGTKIIEDQIPLEELRGKKILIVDDICCFGGTFYYAGKLLQEYGVEEIYLYVSHCEDKIMSEDLDSSGVPKGILCKPDNMIKGVYTTDSLVLPAHPMIEVINVKEVV